MFRCFVAICVRVFVSWPPESAHFLICSMADEVPPLLQAAGGGGSHALWLASYPDGACRRSRRDSGSRTHMVVPPAPCIRAELERCGGASFDHRVLASLCGLGRAESAASLWGQQALVESLFFNIQMFEDIYIYI